MSKPINPTPINPAPLSSILINSIPLDPAPSNQINLKPGTITRDEIVGAARSWIGTPYVHQASTIEAGTDCLGLVRGVWRMLYAGEPEIPPAYTPDWTERHWNRITGSDPLLEAARRHLHERLDAGMDPGDVLVFRVNNLGPAKHCGILTEPGRFVHASSGHDVCEIWLNRWWHSRIVGAFSFPGVM